MELLLIKQPNGTLAPADEESAEAIASLRVGAPIRAKCSRVRNYPFLQKYMTLVNLAYDMWAETYPEMEYKGVQVKPNKDRFRRDLTILTGHFHAHYNIRGEVRLEAKSISFARMSEEEFSKLYSKTIDVILEKILAGRGMTAEQLRNAVDRVLAYA